MRLQPLWKNLMTVRRLIKLVLLINLATALHLKEIKNPLLIHQITSQTRILSHYHDFIQIIDLKPLKIHTNQLRNQINAFKFSCHLGRSFQLLFDMFSNIQEKLDNFDNSKRTKRGLINLVGTIGKQLFGLADDDD